jgi:hypothetical protein
VLPQQQQDKKKQQRGDGRVPSPREWAIHDPKTFTALMNTRFSHQEAKSYLQLNRALKVYEMNKDQYRVGRLLRKMPDRRNHFQVECVFL